MRYLYNQIISLLIYAIKLAFDLSYANILLLVFFFFDVISLMSVWFVRHATENEIG
jgi:hypothetical protein